MRNWFLYKNSSSRVDFKKFRTTKCHEKRIKKIGKKILDKYKEFIYNKNRPVALGIETAKKINSAVFPGIIRTDL